MKKVVLNSKVVKLYDSIDEMPIVNFQKYNKFLLIDSGIGSDIDDIDSHIIKIAQYIKFDNKEKAMAELQNMRQNLFMISSNISPQHLAFAALIKSVDDKEVIDLSDDALKEVMFSLRDVKHATVMQIFMGLKKKLQTSSKRTFRKILLMRERKKRMII